MIDPALAKASSPTVTTIAKQLWPTMLFLVVMSLITLFGSYWWTSSIGDKTSAIIAFWMWFISNTVVTGYGVYAFITDTRIQAAKQGISPK